MTRNWLRRQQGYGAEREKLDAWWAEAQRQNEEEYLLARVFPKDAHRPDARVLEVIAARPRRIGELYLQALEGRPGLDDWALAARVARSTLPRDEKVALLLRGTVHEEPARCHAALAQLCEIAPDRFVEELLKNLEALPGTWEGPAWTSPVAAIGHLAVRTDDPRIWRALLVASKRADVGLRLELMNVMNYSFIGGGVRRERLEYLAHFLDDEAIRDRDADPLRFEGPCAAFTERRIAVRDFAAAQISSILGSPNAPPRASPADSATLRATVRDALAKEGIEAK